jgi:hypothetical protein
MNEKLSIPYSMQINIINRSIMVSGLVNKKSLKYVKCHLRILLYVAKFVLLKK